MFQVENFEEFMSIQIDIMHIFHVKNQNLQLKPIPKKFYIYCIFLYLQGVDITTTEAVDKISKYMGWKTNNNVYTYRTNLQKLGWFVPDATTWGGYNIHPNFRKLDKNNLVKHYQFSLKCIDPNI